MRLRLSLTEPIQSIACVVFESISIHCVALRSLAPSIPLAAGVVRCPQSGLAFRLAFLLELTETPLVAVFQVTFMMPFPASHSRSPSTSLQRLQSSCGEAISDTNSPHYFWANIVQSFRLWIPALPALPLGCARGCAGGAFWRVVRCYPVGKCFFSTAAKLFFRGVPGVLWRGVLWCFVGRCAVVCVCCAVRPASLPGGAACFFHFFKKFFKIFSVWSLFSGTASKTAGGICGTSAGLYRVHRAHRAHRARDTGHKKAPQRRAMGRTGQKKSPATAGGAGCVGCYFVAAVSAAARIASRYTRHWTVSQYPSDVAMTARAALKRR